MKIYKVTVDDVGTICWYNEKGQLHREDGPAIKNKNRDKWWYINGKLHREDGPAVEYSNGNKYWYINNQCHREDGPAIEHNGYKQWYLNGKMHREDGPAIEYSTGEKYWYLNGIHYTETTWKKEVAKLKAPTNEDISKALADIDRAIEVLNRSGKYNIYFKIESRRFDNRNLIVVGY